MDVLSVFTLEDLELTDTDLGRRVLDYWIAGVAEKNHLDAWNLPQEFIDRVVQEARHLKDGDCTAESDFLLIAIRMAANGQYDKAGRFFRSRFLREAEILHARCALANQDADTRRGRKVVAGARKSHEKTHGEPIDKANERTRRLALLAKIRRENPGLSDRKVYEIAEAESESAFGARVSYKTFSRADKTKV
ncbi:MAG: hypothetical protein FIA97_03715 [Methylococcaceae bacterium]|nr:hypothetical protein [Methylococcaceae bacterium]